ncbi:MAG TPA: cobalamin biosynthesis protein CbiX [Cyanobacteria bacterium UBA8803]|nr:cobalamin biosynthesis protein CbiX [Cyanobacteria bacterium UBA9273]HBL59879.1 cobalamin biosynthesis protein CbiX [Cyanobacteria bacterium UBA8803]
MSSAYLLVYHGSRDPRPQLAVEKLADLVSALLGNQYPLVGTATLELATLPLHEQIRDFANKALEAGYHQVQLVPLFLLPGVHVMEDIPREVTLAKRILGQAIAIDQRPHLGSHPSMGKMLATVEADAKIVLAHGSRRRDGNQPIEAIAEQLEAVVAYWSIQPTLAEQIQSLADAGHKSMAILPYFLFSGTTTDAIAQKVVQLQTQFPQLELKLREAMGATSQLAELILELLEKPSGHKHLPPNPPRKGGSYMISSPSFKGDLSSASARRREAECCYAEWNKACRVSFLTFFLKGGLFCRTALGG